MVCLAKQACRTRLRVQGIRNHSTVNSHPNIVELHGAYEDNHYVHVLTRCEGSPLLQQQNVVAQQGLPRMLIARYTSQLASAVDHCHSNGEIT